MSNKKSKNVNIGAIFVTEKDGNKRVSIGLGTKGSKPEYTFSVEMIVRDGHGNIVSKQTDGFVNLTDPRQEPHDLLKAGFIGQDVFDQMVERVQNLSPKIKYNLRVPRSQ